MDSELRSATEQTPATDAPAEVPSTANDADEARSCFICLQTAAETPGAAWVTPCPCTLEAHEACMLRWIAETEMGAATADGGDAAGAGAGAGGGRDGRRRGGGIRCPACNSRIRTEEPWDPVVALGDSWTQAYRRASPFVLLSTFLSMAMAGSSFYGFQSMVQVAGEQATYDWFFFAGAARLRQRGGLGGGLPTPLDRWREAAALFRKVLLLNLVAPGLLLHRAMPSVTNLLALPVSTVYGFYLLSHKKLPTRPLSPAWAMVLAPFVSTAYLSTYYSMFGALEKRLNLALRGRPTDPAAEDLAAPVPAALPADAQPAGQPEGAQQQQQQPRRQGDDGVFGAALRLMRNGILNTLLRPEENMLIENAGAAAGFVGGGGGGGGGGELAIQLEINMVAEEAVAEDDGPADDEGNDEENDEGDDEAADAAAVPPPDIRRRRRQDNNGDNRPPDADNGNAADVLNNNNVLAGGGEASLLVTDVVSAMAAQLLLPHIASLMGRVLELTLPRAWVMPPPSPPGVGSSRGRAPAARGLLQQRWGRSLVGGCLYVVLRDGWNLYTKYRRVQVKRQRKIKNVDRRQRGGGGPAA